MGIFHQWPKNNGHSWRSSFYLESSCFAGQRDTLMLRRITEQALLGGHGGLTWRNVTWRWRHTLGFSAALVCSSSPSCGLPWTSCAPVVVSLCADEFSDCYVLQPPESKPNFTPLAILAHVLGAIQPYAHLIHVQRLIPHQVCCRVCLVLCCCLCSLIGLVLSSCSVQPPRQLYSLPSKPALAFWQARRSGSWRHQVKSRIMTNLVLFIQSCSGTTGDQPLPSCHSRIRVKAGRGHLHEPWHFPRPSEPFLQFLN